MRFFSYDDENGFTLHETEEEAKNSANDALEIEREEASEGWSDSVETICWGEIKQHIVETMNRKRTDDDTYVSADCEHIVDYGLSDF